MCEQVRNHLTIPTGLIVKVGTPDEFGAFMRAESGKWGKLISDFYVKVE